MAITVQDAMIGQNPVGGNEIADGFVIDGAAGPRCRFR
jgi:hypothetical protein